MQLMDLKNRRSAVAQTAKRDKNRRHGGHNSSQTGIGVKRASPTLKRNVAVAQPPLVNPTFLEEQTVIALKNHRHYEAVVEAFRRDLVRDLHVPIRYEIRQELSADGETWYSWSTGENAHRILHRPELGVFLPCVRAHELMHVLVTSRRVRKERRLRIPGLSAARLEAFRCRHFLPVMFDREQADYIIRELLSNTVNWAIDMLIDTRIYQHPRLGCLWPVKLIHLANSFKRTREIAASSTFYRYCPSPLLQTFHGITAGYWLYMDGVFAPHTNFATHYVTEFSLTEATRNLAGNIVSIARAKIPKLGDDADCALANAVLRLAGIGDLNRWVTPEATR